MEGLAITWACWALYALELVDPYPRVGGPACCVWVSVEPVFHAGVALAVLVRGKRGAISGGIPKLFELLLKVSFCVVFA